MLVVMNSVLKQTAAHFLPAGVLVYLMVLCWACGIIEAQVVAGRVGVT
jgi:hypothetical protein